MIKSNFPLREIEKIIGPEKAKSVLVFKNQTKILVKNNCLFEVETNIDDQNSAFSIEFRPPNTFFVFNEKPFSDTTYLGIYCILERFGPTYFWQLRNLEDEKKELLLQSGLENLDIEFTEFGFNPLNGLLRIVTYPEKATHTENPIELYERWSSEKKPIIIWQFNPFQPKISLELKVLKKVKNDKSTIKYSVLTFIDSNTNAYFNSTLNQFIEKLTLSNIYQSLGEGIGFQVSLLNNTPFILTEQKQKLWRKMLHDNLHNCWIELAKYPLQHINIGNNKYPNFQPCFINLNLAFPQISIEKKNNQLQFSLQIKVGARIFTPNEFSFFDGVIIKQGQQLYRVAPEINPNGLELFENENQVLIPIKNGIANSIQTWLSKLDKQVPINYKNLPELTTVDGKPECSIQLSELTGNYLVIKPLYKYEDFLLPFDNTLETLASSDDRLVCIQRDLHTEKAFFETVRALHPIFKSQLNNNYFYISFSEVVKKNWIFKILNDLKTNGLSITGFEKLSLFKINSHTPKLQVAQSGNNDWFDLQISATWGRQTIGLRTLKKSIANGDETVLLPDGTLGMIPSEWIHRFSLLFSLATESDKQLRISKAYLGLMDEDTIQILLGKFAQEAINRRQKLLSIDTNTSVAPVPHQITVNLRPYQLAGYEWLQKLANLGLGACLADDMGLGKTLQTITFLRQMLNQKPNSICLVVCPTSLLFNWKVEFEKFSPTTSVYMHYGANRLLTENAFLQYEVVLTSYGTVRSDLAFLSQFDWYQLVLDESQYIKNPMANLTKAVCLLPAQNRIVLSGTPLQNNTFDLFSQINFILPGYLGSQAFFRTRFANPIDKQNSKEAAEELRRLVNPFILRRTKDQVATDLPAKNEMILWCDMLPDQQKAYDYYRNAFKNKVLGLINDQGLEKSGIYVLEGLLRLRQICDHPALVKDPQRAHYGSAKLNLLIQEILALPLGQKALVFSQFTEMLAIIRNEFEQHEINYCYLDGSTPTKERQSQVTDFQESDSKKVFLLSLKAGGVGLNLTAAEYVFIVDPWWNPAAEQQAIDRSHRIGQNKKVFAYKMVCKGTVEEKILALQQKKKELSNNLISNEAGFVKSLTKEDISYLFS